MIKTRFIKPEEKKSIKWHIYPLNLIETVPMGNNYILFSMKLTCITLPFPSRPLLVEHCHGPLQSW